MPEKSLIYICFLILLISFGGAYTSFGQVSLLPGHNITVDGIVDRAGNKASYNVIRDYKKENRWYYVPIKPLLLERAPSNRENPKPAFQLVTYQAKKDSDLYEGGILQFTATMAISENEVSQIEKAIKRKLGLSISPTVIPLPYHKAEATLYDASGNRSAEAPKTPGLAPAFVTGTLPFQLKLDNFGSDLYSALVDSKNGGVGVLMVLTFEGILPPAGFKITVDWDMTYKHISSSSETKVAIGTFFCGLDVNVSKTKIREELVSASCIKIESTTNEAVTDEVIDKYLDPVLARIQKELIEKIKTPEIIDPKNRDKPDFMKKCFSPISVSTSVVMKDFKIVRKGTETFEFNQAVIVDRKTACGAFIGINSYPESVKKNLIRVMTLDSWASAFLLLPGVQNTPELHLNAVSMTANVVDAKGNAINTLSDTASWKASSPNSWKDKDGDDTGNLKFPLLSLFKKHNNKIEEIRKEYQFKVDVKIEQQLGRNLHTVRTTYFTPLFDGDLPMAAPVDLVDNIIVDASLLTFSRSGLKKANILIREEGSNEKLEHTFTARNIAESSIVFIVDAARDGKPPKELLATIKFDTQAARNIPWEYNGKNLRELDPSLYFLLFDSDWEK